MHKENKGTSALPARHFELGFTLMETLLAVTLFAIVITSSFGVFQMGVQIWKRSTGDARYERKIYMVLEKMQTDIQASLPIFNSEVSGLGANKEIEFRADENGFLFPAVIPVENEKGEMTFQYGGLGYAWNSSGYGICEQVLTATDFFLRKKPACRNVLPNVRRAGFEYLVGNSVTKSYSWYKDWNGKDGIPRAVRISFEVRHKDKKNDPVRKFSKTFWIPVSDKVRDELKVEAPV